MPPFRSLVAALALAACGPASAQQMKPPGMREDEAAGRRFPQPVRVGDLLGRTVLQPLESQPVLGRVERLVRRGDGRVDVVIRYGGVLGLGSRPIAVPLAATAVLGEYLEVVDDTPDQLDRFPTDAGTAAALAPDEVVRVGLARPSH